MRLEQLVNPRPRVALGVGITLSTLALFTNLAVFAYREHRNAVNAARQAEWFSVCSATGWKTDVCKLSCRPADRVPEVEVQP